MIDGVRIMHKNKIKNAPVGNDGFQHGFGILLLMCFLLDIRKKAFSFLRV
jgi:hypothetical protein